MSDVQFDNERNASSGYIKTNKEGGLIGFLISKGVARDKSQANLILICVIVVMTIIFFISVSSGSEPSNNTKEALIELG